MINDYQTIIDYLDRNPNFDPGWAAYKRTSPGNVWQGDKLLGGYGGDWDRRYNRQPGADYEGSIQQLYDWILVKSGKQPSSDFGKYHYGAYGNLGSGRSPGGQSYDIGTSAPGGTSGPGTGAYRGIPRPPRPPGGTSDPFDQFFGPDGTGSYQIAPNKGGYNMPRDSSGGPVWQNWLNQVQGYQPMDEAQLDIMMPEATPETRALALVNDLLNKTNAGKFLSPYYINALRRQAAGGQLGQRQVLANVGGEQPLSGGSGMGDFIKSFVGASSTGLGNVTTAGTQAAIQNLISRLAAGRGATEGYNSDLFNIMKETPVGLSKLLQLGVTGPFADIIKSNIFNRGMTGPLQPNEYDWIDFLLQAMPNRGGYNWNPSRAPQELGASSGW